MAKSKLRRSCGAMAAHMMLLETYPAFRANQMRLEAATDKLRSSGVDLEAAALVTIKTIVHVVYKLPAQNISDAQINTQIAALNKDYSATNTDKTNADAVQRTGRERQRQISARESHAHPDNQDFLYLRRRR